MPTLSILPSIYYNTIDISEDIYVSRGLRKVSDCPDAFIWHGVPAPSDAYIFTSHKDVEKWANYGHDMQEVYTALEGLELAYHEYDIRRILMDKELQGRLLGDYVLQDAGRCESFEEEPREAMRRIAVLRGETPPFRIVPLSKLTRKVLEKYGTLKVKYKNVTYLVSNEGQSYDWHFTVGQGYKTVYTTVTDIKRRIKQLRNNSRVFRVGVI